MQLSEQLNLRQQEDKFQSNMKDFSEKKLLINDQKIQES